MPDLATIVSAPKALLHDHLDGGLRPSTIIDLAAEYGYTGLPTTDVDDLEAWIRRGADRKSLELYLETFTYTVGVMQWPDAIARVAAECAEDLAADGVAYAEVRMAPELCTERGLTLDEAVAAMLDGFRIGSQRAAEAGRPIVMKLLVTAMRQAARSVEVAETAVRWRDAGVVGFDIAGPEAGFRPTRHLDAFDFVRRENFHITIHAGESFGPPSIWEALQFCGAERLGHGVRIVDDITVRDDGSVELGRLAAFVRDRRVPLEMCPTSNVHTGAAASIAEHPIDLLRRLRYRVTVNTDNRLMSGVTLSIGVRGARRRLRDRSRRNGMADHQRHEERLRPLRRAPPDHQRGDQARLRPPPSRRSPGRRRLTPASSPDPGPSAAEVAELATQRDQVVIGRRELQQQLLPRERQAKERPRLVEPTREGVIASQVVSRYRGRLSRPAVPIEQRFNGRREGRDPLRDAGRLRDGPHVGDRMLGAIAHDRADDTLTDQDSKRRSARPRRSAPPPSRPHRRPPGPTTSRPAPRGSSR